jgi:hypothetical protein
MWCSLHRVHAGWLECLLLSLCLTYMTASHQIVWMQRHTNSPKTVRRASTRGHVLGAFIHQQLRQCHAEQELCLAPGIRLCSARAVISCHKACRATCLEVSLGSLSQHFQNEDGGQRYFRRSNCYAAPRERRVAPGSMTWRQDSLRSCR